jgi:hypothetical protein
MTLEIDLAANESLLESLLVKTASGYVSKL